MNVRRYSFSLHFVAMLVVIATFPLIFMGGLVTSHQAGMSVPDWPNSYGYNMFLFPPRLWVGGILYEHTHRLAATVVGMLSILLTITAWLSENPRWVKWLATSVLGAVIFQGVLGGLRVVFVQLDLAIVHACVAQAFFCLAALTAVVSSRWWIETRNTAVAEATTPRGTALRGSMPRGTTLRGSTARAGAGVAGRRLVILAFVCVAAIYGQLIVGACMRHFRAGLAIPDFPTNYGHLLPPTSSKALPAINYYRAVKLNLEPVALWQIWLHFAHRVGAAIVSILLLGLIGHVIYHNRRDRKLLVPALALLILLALQITLGVLTVLLRKPADIASSHVAVGALILMTTFVLAVRARHLYSLPVAVAEDADASRSADLKALPV